MAAQNDVSETPAGRATLSGPQRPQRTQDAPTVTAARECADSQPEEENDEPDQSFLAVLLRALSVWST
jgi:hypothetical protein